MLERQTQLLETNVAGALRTAFRPRAIVLDSLGAHMRPGGCGLQERFPATPVILMKAVDDALAQLAGHSVIISEIDRNPAVTAVVEFIARHYGEPLTVSRVANAVNSSAGRLAHLFPEITGFP